jgi:hypothetical protein
MGVTIFPDPNWTELRSKTVNLTKFPFWSAIITPVISSVSLAASAGAAVTIQPPAGETWLITFGGDITNSTSGNEVSPILANGTASAALAKGNTGYPGASIKAVISNAAWGVVNFYNASTAAQTGRYAYSGFKLSKPHWQPERIAPSLPYKRPLGGRLLAFPKLKERAFVDPEDKIRYQVFEQDLAKDPNTGHIVEKLTVEVTEDDLKKNLTAFQTDPVKTGWDRIFKHLEKEGITL